jgi:REP element-mobilizing transposase RayT
MNLRLYAVGVVSDHVHIALAIPPSERLSDVVRYLKGASTHAVNQQPNKFTFAWQREYAALTFSDRGMKSFVDYVFAQKERHANKDLIAGLERVE